MHSHRCVKDTYGRALCMCDRCSRDVGQREYFAADRSLPRGEIFRSSWLSVELDDMPDGDFGQVELENRPFQITLNRNVAQPRLEASAAHEILHIMDELFKMNLTHEQLHGAAVWMSSEGFPAFRAVRALGSR